MFYIYRSTTDKLSDALNRVVESGDSIRDVVHVGGRDWVLICRKGADPTAAVLKAVNAGRFASGGDLA